MRISPIRFLAVTLLLVVLHASPARADVTITGTVGEIGVMPPQQPGCGGQATIFRFKLTDLNQTKTCNQANNPIVAAGYAWFWGGNNNPNCGPSDPGYREWYAALLVSKKGSPITCTITDNVGCHVTSCTLN